MSLLPFLNLVLAMAGLVLVVATVALVVDYFVYKGTYFADLLKKVTWPIVILITIGSLVLSLVYSEYYGFIPCSLCWLQRIAIYPQALLSIVAHKLRDNVFFPIYGIGLSVFGLVTAVYHYLYQMLPADGFASGMLPCLADGTNADCALKVIDEFGFVTFPFISAATFAFLLMVYLYQLRSTRVS